MSDPPKIEWKLSKSSDNRSTEFNGYYAVVFPTIDGDVGWWAEKIGTRWQEREIAEKGRKATIAEAVKDAEEFLRSEP